VVAAVVVVGGVSPTQNVGSQPCARLMGSVMR